MFYQLEVSFCFSISDRAYQIKLSWDFSSIRQNPRENIAFKEGINRNEILASILEDNERRPSKPGIAELSNTKISNKTE